MSYQDPHSSHFITPILILGWRRPDTLSQLLKALSNLQPYKIYISLDGPRPHTNDSELIAATVAVIENEITWDCILNTRYLPHNLGCKSAVSSAISWFFQSESEGIILEDDCIPHPDFFPYVTHILERYRHDLRVWSICGCNLHYLNQDYEYSYLFGSIPLVWGWATWANRWQEYDVMIASWPLFVRLGHLKSTFSSFLQRLYWSSIWDTLYREGKPDTWDYQWTYTCLANRGLSVYPRVNLVNNIGFREDATHSQSFHCDTHTYDQLGDLVDPPLVHPSYHADKNMFYNVFRGHRIILSSAIIKTFFSVLFRLGKPST